MVARNWNIPFALESGSDYTGKDNKCKMTLVFLILSNANFTILGNQVTVTKPNGGEDYLIGSSQIITWTDNLTGSVETTAY